MMRTTYRYCKEQGKMVEVSRDDVASAPAAQVHSYDQIKVWTQAPWKGRGPDPRGFQHHDRDGVPIVTSKAEIDDVQAKTSHQPHRLVWNRDH